MPRSYSICGSLLLSCASILLFITSISLPYLTAMDITRTHFDGLSMSSSDAAITQIRFGIWAYCYDSTSKNDMVCEKTGHGYSVSLRGSGDNSVTTINSSWTRGLAAHPVAAGAAAVAVLLSFSTQVTTTFFASLLAAFITLIAFAIDIALYGYVKSKMKKLSNANDNTLTGPGFWLTFASLILLLVSSGIVWIGHRKDGKFGNSPLYHMTSSKKGFFGKFRRN